MTVIAKYPFTPERHEQVISDTLEGKSLKTIAESIGCSPSVISSWMIKHPLFGDAMRSARAEAAHLLMDETVTIADTAEDPQKARNQIQARWRLAETRNRKEYGQSVDVNLTERVDLGGTLIEARRRSVLPACDLAQITDVQVIDITPTMDMRATDTQSVTTVPAVNPFD